MSSPIPTAPYEDQNMDILPPEAEIDDEDVDEIDIDDQDILQESELDAHPLG